MWLTYAHPILVDPERDSHLHYVLVGPGLVRMIDTGLDGPAAAAACSPLRCLRPAAVVLLRAGVHRPAAGRPVPRLLH